MIAAVLCTALLGSAAPSMAAQPTPAFYLVSEALEVEPVRLLRIDDELIEFRILGNPHREARPLSEVLAILREPPPSRPDAAPKGMLRLVDGRQFPGEIAMPAGTATNGSQDALAWHSNWFGRMVFRLEQIDWITLSRDAAPPPPGRADVVLLTNGDVLDGFISSFRKVIELEIEQAGRTSTMEIPLDRIAAVNMVSAPGTGPSAREPSQGRRVWLADGTILDLHTLEVDDGGVVRLSVARAGDERASRDRDRYSLDARHLAAVSLSPGRMIPLASLDPVKVEGPPTRYTVPAPRLLDRNALLKLSPIELRGPLTVGYELPPGAKRFAMEVTLPEVARTIGDCWLIVRVAGEEVVRQRVNRTNPRITVNLPIPSDGPAQLDIEVASGESGPVQNHLILKRAMLLID